MGKGTHFIGQPMCGQLLNLLDGQKILRISRDRGGERYVKHFDAWQHLVVMLYAVIKRFDSLREISDTMYQNTGGQMACRIQHVAFRKRAKGEDDIVHHARAITYVDVRKDKAKLISLLTNDMEMEAEDIAAIYRKRWEIELLFKQFKQNFPLRYFYGESANAIKIQIWVTLIANLLLLVIQWRIKRPWNFSGLATMFRIMLKYYVNCYTFLENPEKDWAMLLEKAEESPPELTLFE